jgi:adenylate kinase
MQKYNALILFGAPGCGKGTQGRALGALPGFFHCACGDVFRSIPSTTLIGKQISEFSSRGELVPGTLTIELWKEHICKRVQTLCFNPETDLLVLDGIPRNVEQARLLEDTIQVKALINLQCSDRSELVARLRRRALRENRLDDAKEEVILHRLEVFETISKPLLDFYGAELICHADSQEKPAYVLHTILDHIRKIATREICA